jgi:hypothetical protein
MIVASLSALAEDGALRRRYLGLLLDALNPARASSMATPPPSASNPA